MNLSTLSDMPAPIRRVLKRFGFTADSVERLLEYDVARYVAIIRGRPFRVAFIRREHLAGFDGVVSDDGDDTLFFTLETAAEQIKRLILTDLS